MDMTSTEFFGVVGTSSILGVVISKLFDIIWLQNKAMRNETIKWLRDKRLKVFGELSADFATLGLRSGRNDILEIVAHASEVTLLINDQKLQARIMTFVDDLCSLHQAQNQIDESDMQELTRLLDEARLIIQFLREALMDKTLTKLI
jgi:hypothetical protein